jgi:hypothetical protein
MRVTLLLAALAIAVVVVRRLHAQRAPIAIAAVVLSIAISMGVDTTTIMRNQSHTDARMRELEAITPHRFALVGWGPDTDTTLALRAERDIVYLDFTEAANWDGFRQLMDY